MVPLVVIVGADKGGTGKTFTSRALLDYFKTESPTGSLKRFFPLTSTIVDLTKADDQIQVFDNLTRAAVTVIDVRAGLLSNTLQTLGDIGFLDMVKEGKIKIAVMHVIGSNITSLNEVKATAVLMQGAQHFLVKNHTNDSDFFKGIDSVAKDMFNGQVVIDIPKLNETASEHVDASGLSFQQFINDDTQSRVIRGYVSKWLVDVYKQFDTLKLA
jgi:Cdc6-like AAA superfamily ATPase